MIAWATTNRFATVGTRLGLPQPGVSIRDAFPADSTKMTCFAGQFEREGQTIRCSCVDAERGPPHGMSSGLSRPSVKSARQLALTEGESASRGPFSVPRHGGCRMGWNPGEQDRSRIDATLSLRQMGEMSTRRLPW